MALRTDWASTLILNLVRGPLNCGNRAPVLEVPGYGRTGARGNGTEVLNLVRGPLNLVRRMQVSDELLNLVLKFSILS